MTRGRLEYPSGYSDFFIVNWKAEPIALAIGVDAKTRSGILDHTKASFPVGHLRQRHRRYTAAGGPGDGHLHDRDLRKGADTMAKRRKPRQRQSDRRPPLGRAVFTRRAGRQAELPECLRPYPGRVRGEAESSDYRHESEKELPRMREFSCLWYFCGQNEKTPASFHAAFSMNESVDKKDAHFQKLCNETE